MRDRQLPISTVAFDLRQVLLDEGYALLMRTEQQVRLRYVELEEYCVIPP